jgi:hypothetical protein
MLVGDWLTGNISFDFLVGDSCLPFLAHFYLTVTKKTEMENNEVLRLLRSANIAPGDIPAFIASIKNNNRQDSRTNDGRLPNAGDPGLAPAPGIKQEEASESEKD